MLLETHCIDRHFILADGHAVPLADVDPRLEEVPLFRFYRHDELTPGDFSNRFAPGSSMWYYFGPSSRSPERGVRDRPGAWVGQFAMDRLVASGRRCRYVVTTARSGKNPAGFSWTEPFWQVTAGTAEMRRLRAIGSWVRQVFSRGGGSSFGAPRISPEVVARWIADHYLHDRRLFTLWESYGFHVTPVHFYSPIPRVSDLRDDLWARPSDLVGLDMNEAGQQAFLEEVCSPYRSEYEAFPRGPTDTAYQYYFNQMMFRSVDAEVYYCMIRHYRPRRIVEVGAGFSTYVAAAAVRRNAEEGYDTELIAVDPYPGEVLRRGFPGLSRVISQAVQVLGVEFFGELCANDILFVDGSHVVRIDSDVRFIILEVLPRLKPGVLVHFHDIFLPWDYPRAWVVEEHRFWTEQYLLQAFLAFNQAFEVLWAGSYMHGRHPDLLRRYFPSYDPTTVWPGSFWIRRRR